jgi:hypothetical protein
MDISSECALVHSSKDWRLRSSQKRTLSSFHPALIKFWPSSRIVVALTCTCSIKNCSKSQSAWPVGTRYFQLGLITRHLRERKGFNGGDAIHTVTSPYRPAHFGLTNLTVRIVQLRHECLLRISEGSKPKLLNYYWNIIRPPEFYALLNQCCVINLRVRVSCVSLWTVTRVMLQGARRGSQGLAWASLLIFGQLSAQKILDYTGDTQVKEYRFTYTYISIYLVRPYFQMPKRKWKRRYSFLVPALW